MSDAHPAAPAAQKPFSGWAFIVLAAVGLVTFVHGLLGAQPARAWQAYLINFLLWSGIAQGALVFSALMHITRARWSGPLSGLAETFAGFFPVSLLLYLALLFGRAHVFPWLHADLHGKEGWLNLPFLFTRDAVGLAVLYLVGFAYLYWSLQAKFDPAGGEGAGLRGWVARGWRRNGHDLQLIRRRMTVWGTLYILAFVLVLCLVGFDLVMAADPHWISTLFGGYTFVKAFYTGLGALIILAAVRQLRAGGGISDEQFIDVGKLLFAFCLLWADFFYVQLTVIWYGNLPEETHYVILRTMLAPWRTLAWVVFAMAFVVPFVVLLNRRVKARPAAMIVLCGLVIVGIWLEHLLLLGPAILPQAPAVPLGLHEVLIFLGFMGLMVVSVARFMRAFPETAAAPRPRWGEQGSEP